MQRLPARVGEILRYSYGSDTFRNGREVVGALHRILCRTVTLANPLRTQIDAEAREIQSLTDSQIDAFAKFQRIRRVAVGGGAGAGKTYARRATAPDSSHARGFERCSRVIRTDSPVS